MDELKPYCWSNLQSLEIARSHPSTAAYEGKIYAFGGGGPNFKSLSSAICLDPETNEWSECASMPTLRSGTVAATMGDYIYVAGGGFRQEDGKFRFLTTVEIFHPKTNTWTKGPDLINPHDYPAVAVIDGCMYVLGGHHPKATEGGPKTDPGFDFCERLDPNKGAWEAIAELPTPRFALSAVTHEGKILAMGGVAFRPEGFNNFTTIEIYDPKTNQWSEDESLKLPWPAAGLGSAKVGDDIFVFGGYSDDNIHNRTARYNTSSKTWEHTGTLPAPVAAMGVTTLKNNIFSIGGWADDGRTPINAAYKFTL
ncbi:Kelch repeat-containing protein [Pseudomonadota bacterium]